ncbi:MAG: aldose epimerase family protein [Rubrivivax sp.]
MRPDAGRDAFTPLRLVSGAGLEAHILPHGARLAALHVPTPRGRVNVVLGYPRPADHAHDTGFLGCVIGRLSGRVARARFGFEGREYALPANAPPHHLHGGPGGLHARAWEVRELRAGDSPSAVLGTTLADGDDGYPGKLEVTATYRLEGLDLQVELEATADRATPVSLTLHPYFNLSGDHGRPITDHRLAIHADHVLELDATLIPTGRRLAVAGTPFDLRGGALIGERLDTAHPQLAHARGFDHTYVLAAGRAGDAELRCAASGLALRVDSNQPGLQFYTGQSLAPPPGVAWRPRCGLCLEPQGFPNAVNEPGFPAPWLRPGERYRNLIRYAFSAG